MTVTEGLRRLRELASQLEDGRKVREPYTEAVAEEARRNARGRPSPQARMVGEAIQVREAVISVPSGSVLTPRVGRPVAAGRVAGGAEYGSSIYRQFGPRKGTPGNFIGAAAASPDSATIQAGEEALESLVREAVR